MDIGHRLDISAGEDDSTLIVAGELDVATCNDLAEQLAANNGTDSIRLDLSGVTFIDSSALRILIEHHERLADKGGRLELVRLSDAATRLFEIAGLDGHFNVS